jgi:hypothetical protein
MCFRSKSLDFELYWPHLLLNIYGGMPALKLAAHSWSPMGNCQVVGKQMCLTSFTVCILLQQTHGYVPSYIRHVSALRFLPWTMCSYFVLFLATKKEPGQFSGIAMGYGLDDRGGGGSRPGQGLRIFLLTIASKLALGPTQPPIQWVAGALSLGVKRPGREADRSPPSSAKVKNARSYTSAPSRRLHGVMLS